MFHAGDIINQSRPFDKDSIIDKFTELLYDLHAQFKLEHLDRLIHSADKYISDLKVENSLIDGIISSRCNAFKKMFSALSLNEQFYILAHFNLDLLTPRVEDPNPVFMSLVNSLVREMIMLG